MLITFKTLEQKTFKIEIEESLKVKALKEKIAEECGTDLFPVLGQKLIYSGKILDDDKTLSDCNIDPKNFVVVMVVKQKPKPAEKGKEDSTSSATGGAAAAAAAIPAAPTTTPSAASTETTPSAPSSETRSETTTITSSELTSETPSTESLTSQISTDIAESTLLTGSALESSITELMSLGYSRDQVMLALNRSFHNADRAAEYLLSGTIPDMPEDMESGGGGVGGGGEAETLAASDVASGDLSFLRNSSQFQRMRAQVQANPDSLPMLLQGIGETNRDLLALINQNQEQFIALLNEQGGEGEQGAEGGGGGAMGGAGGGGGGIQIQVTTSEKEAIDRICAMGFPEPEVIQAFFACDKNEQLAIDFLLSN